MVETALFSLEEAANLCLGDYKGPHPVPGCSGVSIDSRTLRGGELFIPLQGEQTDGHLYLQRAFEQGAAGVLCGRDYYNENRKVLHYKAGSKVGIIVVENTLKAFWSLAEGYLEGFPKLKRLGVTGSSGKTTTKEILGSIFSRFASTVMNEGNLNSETGLPLSVLGVRPEHRFGIFEMGINHPGEMEILARIVKPEAAVLTNLGTAHIGLLGSREAIAKEKSGVFSYLGSDGVAFIAEDEEYTDILMRGLDAEVVRFGRHTTKGFDGAKDLGLHGWELQLFGRSVHFPLIGSFNLKNALCAVTVARYFGVDEMTICSGLQQVKPLFGRGQILHGRTTVLHDCYNANPNSLLEALEFLDNLAWEGRKVAILGAMKELGEETAASHRVIVERAAASGIDAVFFLGQEYKAAAEGYSGQGEERLEWCGDFDELSLRVQEIVHPQDIVLVKGSRGMALERITDYIV